MLPPYDGYYMLKDSGEKQIIEEKMKDESLRIKKPMSVSQKIMIEAAKINKKANRSLADV